MHLSKSHNTPFRTEMCTFLFWMVNCGIWDRCIVGFMGLVYYFVHILNLAATFNFISGIYICDFHLNYILSLQTCIVECSASNKVYHGPLTRYVKLRVAHALGMNARNVFPATDFNGNRQLATPACITARASRTCRGACRDRLPAVAGKTFPAFPAHAQPAILRIW